MKLYLYKFLFLLILLGFVFTGCGDNDEVAEERSSATAIAGYEVAPMNLSRTVRASARVEAENVVTIASRMEGLITNLYVREGDEIEAGDVILTFDVEERQAELDRAKAERELAQTRYNRNETLLERDAISIADYEESRAELKMAENNVALWETRVRFGTVRAPGNMTVLRRHVEKGDAVSTNESLFQVADLNRLVVRLGIPERDVVHLSRGQEVRVRVDAFPDRVFQGSIQRIYPAAEENSRLVTVEVTLRSEQKDERIQPGFLARVSLDAERMENVIAVPSEALLASESDDRFVYIINNEDRLERRNVSTGTERRNWTQITDGLQVGDVLVGANPSNLREDIIVNVTRWIENDDQQMADIR